MKKILIIASGLSAKEINDYNYKSNGWTIVAVNNGWMVTQQWDHWIRASDFKGNKPEKILSNQTVISKYGKFVSRYGGQKECGYSITLTAGYYSLCTFNPDVVGFLGADMDYTPQKDGSTHIYGVGNDILKNNIPDPDRMVEHYSKGDPNYLGNIYMRFSNIAKDRHNTDVFNFSKTEITRLPYPKNDPRNFEV